MGETFSLPSSLPSLTCKFLFLCAKKIISFFEDQLKKKSKKKMHRGTLCCALRNKNCKNWKRAFSKSTPVYPRLLWTKALPISKKSFFLEKKKSFLFVEIIYKNQRSILYTCFLVVHKRCLWRSCGFLYYSVIYINVCIQSNRMTYYSISLPSKTPRF